MQVLEILLFRIVSYNFFYDCSFVLSFSQGGIFPELFVSLINGELAPGSTKSN